MVSVDLRGGGERVVVGQRLGGGRGADHADPAVAGGGDRPAGRRAGSPRPPARRSAPGRRAASAALAELQAITSALTPWSTRWSRHSRAYSRTSPIGFGPYGCAGGVAEVDDRLVRQLVDHRPGHGQPAEAGVEDADRRVATFEYGAQTRQARCERTTRTDIATPLAAREARRRRSTDQGGSDAYSNSLAWGGPKDGSTPSNRLLTDSPACTRAIASANRPATLRTFSSGQPEARGRCRS